MMTELGFRYRAIGTDGTLVAGEILAADRAQAIEALRRQGQLPVAVDRSTGFDMPLGRARGLSTRRTASLFAALAMLLQNGVALDQALGLLAGPDEDAAVARVAAALRARVQSGATLAAAMAEAGSGFDRVALAIIRAGEEGGRLAEAAAAAATQLEAARLAGERARSALAYPLLVLAAALATLVLIAIVVAPAFLPLFADRRTAPPFALAVLAGFGAALADWWPVLLLLAAAAWLAARRLLAQPALRLLWHRRLLALPRLGKVIAAIEFGRFAAALGSLLAAGVQLPRALVLAQGVMRNTALAADIAAATIAVRAGNRLASALGTLTQPPAVARQLLAVGEQSGQVAPALLRIAAVCQHQVQQDTERMLALLGPALVIGLGGLVAFVLSALLGAVLDANQLVL